MPPIAGFRGVLEGERDPARAVYRYHQVFAGPGRTLTRKNVILAVRLSPWSEGTIRPHEAADPAGRAAALAAIRAAAAHAEPFVAGFRDQAGEVERLFRTAESARPTREVSTPDGTRHRLWRVADAELLGTLRHYLAPKKLHVLEGHDRYEAMLAYHAELAAAHALATYSAANYGLACLVSLDDQALVTASRHRVLRGEGLAREAVLERARAHFLVEPLAGAARDLARQQAALAQTVAHQPAFVAVFAGEPDAWKLTLSPDVSPFAEGAASHRALQKLAPVVVDNLFVARAAPAAQVTSDPDAARALAALDAGAGAVLIVPPLAIEQIAHVDDLGQLLPAGSTALHPAIASLVTLPIDPDEDLV